jgi:hypothetical protein
MHENTTKITEYVHGGGEASDEMSDLWPPEAKQQETFHYCLYEESVGIEVDLDTGEWRYLSFGGIELSEPSPWFPVRR